MTLKKETSRKLNGTKTDTKKKDTIYDNPPEDVNIIDILEFMVNKCVSPNFDWKKASIDPEIIIDAYYNTFEIIYDYTRLNKNY